MHGLGPDTMESLHLKKTDLSDASLRQIALRHGRLRSLFLEKCEEITTAGLSDLLRSASRLEILKLHYCRRVKDGVLEVLEAGCARLRKLQIWACPICDNAVERFRRSRPSVVVDHIEFFGLYTEMRWYPEFDDQTK